MKLYKIFGHKRNALIAAVASFAMLFFFPIFQSLGSPNIWFTFIKPVNFILYLAFSVLFGITIAVQYHAFRQRQQSCGIKSVSAQAGSVLGLFSFQCAACFPVLAQALGIGTVTFLSIYKTQLILFSMALMVLSLHMLGAFKD